MDKPLSPAEWNALAKIREVLERQPRPGRGARPRAARPAGLAVLPGPDVAFLDTRAGRLVTVAGLDGFLRGLFGLGDT